MLKEDRLDFVQPVFFLRRALGPAFGSVYPAVSDSAYSTMSDSVY